MSLKGDLFLKKTLGDDFFESLAKVELWKPGTRSVVDHEEIRTALKIVPRTIMTLLINALTPVKIGQSTDIKLPVEPEAVIRATKHERDVYSGTIEQENKVVVDFKWRSIPGLGLVVMSAFELYELPDLKEDAPADLNMQAEKNVQRLIDERLALHDLVNAVVDKKLLQQEALKQFALLKLTQRIEKPVAPPPLMPPPVTPPPAPVPAFAKTEESKQKGSPVAAFLENRKKKLQKSEFAIVLAKGESVHCPDCHQPIFNQTAFSGCLCFGDDRKNKVHIKKTESGCKVSFPASWDKESMQMLLQILWSKNRK